MEKWTSVVLCIIIASSYVISIHSFKPADLKGKNRNDRDVIKHRFFNVSILTILLIIMVPMVVNSSSSSSSLSSQSAVAPFHFFPTTVSDIHTCLYCLYMIMALYVGPIVDYLKWSPDISSDFKDLFLTIYGFRDHIFAPITEEIIYRSLIVTVLQSGSWKSTQIILWSPLLFGIAHIHHGYELMVHHKLDPIQVIINGVFQAIYTSLFGMLANHIFIDYASLWGCIIIHSVCNLIGFPSLKVEGLGYYQGIYYCLLVGGSYWFYRLV